MAGRGISEIGLAKIRQWIPVAEAGEAAEVAVDGPEFVDAVAQAAGGDAGVVDHGADHGTLQCQFLEKVQVVFGVAEDSQAGGLTPGVDLLKRRCRGGGVSQRPRRVTTP